MSDGKHTAYTPGPLAVNERGSICRENKNGYQEPVKLVGAWIEGAWEGDEEALANATLYAAAPELLEALQALSAVAEMTTFSDQYPSECEMARSAILRATGEGA